MRFLSLFFALSLVACGGSDDSGTSNVDGGADVSGGGDSAIGDAPKDTTPVDTSTSDSSASDTATDDTAADDTATTDTATDDTFTSDAPLDVPEGGLEAGAHCSSDLECATGLKCCYPCGIPGCSNECIPPGPSGDCPLFP